MPNVKFTKMVRVFNPDRQTRLEPRLISKTITTPDGVLWKFAPLLLDRYHRFTTSLKVRSCLILPPETDFALQHTDHDNIRLYIRRSSRYNQIKCYTFLT
ncbi:unnamed protein product [Echinostoma caproni]|uniref:Uncharacterized protein n=1 Tax=Echinostoma caproni TaxID=27848 RepID=A0A183AUX4_9TREM|nr:unnamed protein product [Echinostoma caproni]